MNAPTNLPGATGVGERHFAKAFIRAALLSEIETMLEELGHPPLVEKIFPNGWRAGSDQGLVDLFDLCVRTFRQREKSNG